MDTAFPVRLDRGGRRLIPGARGALGKKIRTVRVLPEDTLVHRREYFITQSGSITGLSKGWKDSCYSERDGRSLIAVVKMEEDRRFQLSSKTNEPYSEVNWCSIEAFFNHTSRTLKFTLLTLFQHDTCGLQPIGLTRPFCVAGTARSDFHTRLNFNIYKAFRCGNLTATEVSTCCT